MPVILDNYNKITKKVAAKNATLVVVTKTKPISDVEELITLGHKDFGENYVQELLEKEAALPKDIHWHFIGHLQSNKVKMIAPFVYLIHGVDSLKLLQEINKQAIKNNRIIPCLLQVHIAQEETKFGFDFVELKEALAELAKAPLSNVHIKGLMGMASLSDDQNVIRKEFDYLSSLFNKHKEKQGWNTLSMGMSSDYELALEYGSTMLRVGSLILHSRVTH
ncbi:MAG: YggS family pyridoxal phosphate-dependent enzyme [Bacteroidota bacterium]